MNDGNGKATTEQSAASAVGKAVADISEKTARLVHEEIELAKAEISQKVAKVGVGAAVAVVAGFFALLGLIFAFLALAWGLVALFDMSVWLAFLLVAVFLFICAALAAGATAWSFKDSSPVPKMAIEEAKKTREMIGAGADGADDG